MRFAAIAAALFLSAGAAGPASGPAWAQAAKPAAESPGAPADVYAAMPEAERMAIQADLIWTGDYAGGVDGDFGPRSLAAARAFQKRSKAKETGVLTAREREQLKLAAERRRMAVGWRVIDDAATGVRLGVPTKLMPQQSKVSSGTRWSSPKGEVQLEAFRITAPGTTLQGVHDAQMKTAQRKVTYNLLRPDFFVVSGTQGTKKVYVRAQARDGQVRGFSVAYDENMAASFDPIVIAMSSAFAGFPDAGPVVLGPPPRRKVEYGSGVVVSAGGLVATTQHLVDGCHQFMVAGLGPADLAAGDKAAGVALLRLYGAAGLVPLPLADTVAQAEVTLTGVADPTAQQGKGEVSQSAGRLVAAEAGARATIEPAPGLGFAGAAVTGADGRLVGLADVRALLLAGPPPTTGAQAQLVPVSALRALLDAQAAPPVPAATAKSEAVRGSVVRVICLRK